MAGLAARAEERRAAKDEGRARAAKPRATAPPPPPPLSARFSGRMAGAQFPRDPRRNAKHRIALALVERARDLTSIHIPPRTYVRTYVAAAIRRVFFTPRPRPSRGNQ